LNFGKINIKYNCYNAIFSQKLSFFAIFCFEKCYDSCQKVGSSEYSKPDVNVIGDEMLEVINYYQLFCVYTFFFYQIILIKSMNVINACLVCFNEVCACCKRICKTFSKLILFKNQWIVFLCFVYVMFMFCLNKLFKHFMCLLFIGNFS